MNYVEQVGGTHYSKNGPAAMQHWDFIDDAAVPYLEGCATKYVVRWKGKNGIQDLRKAISYIQKRLASQRMNKGNGDLRNRVMFYHDEMIQMFDNLEVPQVEREICVAIFCWVDRCELEWAIGEIEGLIKAEEKHAQQTEQRTGAIHG